MKLGAGHLLVVDDSPTVRKLVELTYRATEWTVSFAANGAEAIRVAAEQIPSLILLDVVLPDLPAIEVCDRLARDLRTEEIPIILMSAKDETVRRSFSRYATVVDFIQKPFTPADLAQRIRKAVRLDEHHAPESTLVGRWPASEICSLIGASAGTGELILRADTSTILVYWNRGEIVFVTSLDPKDHHTWMRDSTEAVASELVRAAEQAQRTTGKPVPVTLAEEGELPIGCDLARLLREAGRSMLSNVLVAGKVPFEWRELEALPPFVAIHGRSLPISPNGGTVDPTWPAVQVVFRRAPDAFTGGEDGVLTVRARRVLALIDGRSPLETIADRAGLDIGYASRIVHTLNVMGLIEPAPRSKSDSRIRGEM